jgi:histidyl-tRNA synthetase
VLEGAPRIVDYLDEGSREHLEGLQAILEATGVRYTLNPRLVRGLDYYERTVYEWVTAELGAQGTVCAGGRYDGLVEHLGGRATPAAGFAIGLERVVALLEASGAPPATNPHAYLVMAGVQATLQGARLAESLRDEISGVRLVSNCGGGSLKTQLKRADRSGATLALILAEAELERGEVAVKHLRAEVPQRSVPMAELGRYLGQELELAETHASGAPGRP